MYRVKEVYIKGNGTVTYYKGFKSFEECIDYCSVIMTLNRYLPKALKFTIFKNKIYVGTWESEEYKNANKTKTSNL